jgi:hypothetical protein
MLLKFNLSILRQIVVCCEIAFLMLNGAWGQSSQQSQDERTKEMQQMWQKRRAQAQIKITQPVTPKRKPGTMTQDEQAKKQNNEPPQSNEVSQPKYQIASSMLPAQGQDIGITVWRLKPSQTTDAKEVKQKINPKRLRHPPANTRNDTIFLTAERVDVNTQLRKGDLIQISVEALQDGFLYVINREQYAADNQLTYGEPYLIFPTARTNKGFHHISPGVVINFPAMTDDPFYFEIDRNGDQHIAEELTFLISPTPILWQGEEEADTKQIKLDEKQFELLEKQIRAQTGRIELINGVGKTQTPEEAEAAKASASDGTKRLKHNSPMPQTIFRVARKPDEAFFVKILLKIGE